MTGKTAKRVRTIIRDISDLEQILTLERVFSITKNRHEYFAKAEVEILYKAEELVNILSTKN